MVIIFLVIPVMKEREVIVSYEGLAVIRHVTTSEKLIALTFDDGPDPLYTARVLAVLDKYNARATFFVLGLHVRQYPHLVRREIAAGHEVGLHGYRHVFLTGQPLYATLRDLKRSEELVVQATGYRPVYFRPPFGFYNTAVLRAVMARGYRVVLWTPEMDPRDYTDPGAREIARRVITGAGNGDIVLLHDHGGDRTQTVLALEEILRVLTARGYKFVTLTELLENGKSGKIPT
ncbi:Peptidoglycan/xylan/chitin deacetylase, PgdA/CDA1 family [Desulfofundulus thermosubterraneus DSM 16057]|uniref:Peptidoglycan/xylan/chitin deacetylase, PgdA/CDA1 family n=2 Tax=Desulfofundulus TaxID=2282741 RepID=A0A1M6GQ34_9FIRM|nr:Peptidoglycan/xylan/chitin deacetylase, PgdA/CDA1 family [Desulfofundulus thermosubterraneus DSM 16057]